jgi:hypothetical protein
MRHTSPAAWSTGMTAAEALQRFAPEPTAALARLTRLVADDPRRVALVRWACAAAQELPALPPPAGAREFSLGSELLPPDRTVFAAATQFSIDVSAFGAAQRAVLCELTGDDARRLRGRLLAMCWVADLVPRVGATLDRLFGSAGPTPMGAAGADEPIDDATTPAHDFVRLVHTLHGLDPVLSDLVRLRGAHAHNCRLCKSLRSRSALAAGARLDGFDGGGDLTRAALAPAPTAALALVDAMLWTPARIPVATVDAVREHFTPAQAVELVLDVMRNAWNKTTVAAGLDAAHVADGVEIYEYHDDGRVEFALEGTTGARAS